MRARGRARRRGGASGGRGGVGERWQGSLAGPNREGAGVPRGTVGLLQVGG